MEKDYKPYMKAVKNGFIVCYYTEKEMEDEKGMGMKMDYMEYEKHEVVFPYHKYHDAMSALMKYAAMKDESMDYGTMSKEMMNKPNGMNPMMGSDMGTHHNPGNSSY